MQGSVERGKHVRYEVVGHFLVVQTRILADQLPVRLQLLVGEADRTDFLLGERCDPHFAPSGRLSSSCSARVKGSRGLSSSPSGAACAYPFGSGNLAAAFSYSM